MATAHHETASLDSLRSEIISLLDQLRSVLKNDYGFQSYRVGELINPVTQRHVKIGYSGGEWRMDTGALVGHVVMPDQQQRIDVKLHLNSDRPLPTLDDLVKKVVKP